MCTNSSTGSSIDGSELNCRDSLENLLSQPFPPWLEIVNQIDEQQYTEKTVVDKFQNKNIRVIINSLLSTQIQTPESCIIQLTNEECKILPDRVLATKTKPNRDECYNSITENLIYSCGYYTATFKICVKKALKNVRLYFTADNCMPAFSNLFSVNSKSPRRYFLFT
jgi:hypothetical protein